jgi:hypothetical protein
MDGLECPEYPFSEEWRHGYHCTRLLKPSMMAMVLGLISKVLMALWTFGGLFFGSITLWVSLNSSNDDTEFEKHGQ